jgi:nicotinamidase-related amidase
MPAFNPRETALVLIDLQKGIVGMDHLSPRTGPEVVQTGQALAEKFRAAGAPVVLVHVGFAPDFADAPPQNVDAPLSGPPGGLPTDWSDLVDNLQAPGDLVVFKRQWGAFTGTPLDQQLRRRGIRTIVLAGIATNFGVESTARHAWELDYDVVVVEDGCTTMSAELHEMAFKAILPRISRITDAASVTLADN